MLRSAGLAINTLTGRASSPNHGDDTEMVDSATLSLESSKQAFETHVTEYYTKLQAVVARLRRQAYALEEAGIISAEAAALTSSSAAAGRNDATSQRAGSPGAASTETGRITNGGLGNLDIGWLNSRGNKVAAQKENEIMVEVKELLQDMLANKKDDQPEEHG